MYLRAVSVAYTHFATEFELTNLMKYLFVVEEQDSFYRIVISAPRKKRSEDMSEHQLLAQQPNIYASVIYKIDNTSFRIISIKKIR